MRKLTLALAAIVAVAGLSVGAGNAAAFGLRTNGGPNWLDFRSGVVVDGDRVELNPAHFEIGSKAKDLAASAFEPNPVHW